ncbi:MAG: outer membrane protein assembly factor BamD [Flavobacteriales bacterium]
MYRNKTLMYAGITMLMAIGASCSEYNKILKSTDVELKYTKALEYYNDDKCYKALPLLEELIGLSRGTQRAEDIYYYYAKTQYCLEDYYLANYYFKSFSKTFSNSQRAEECLFQAAMCSFQLSPNYTLDQTDTRNAIDEYQLFLDQYPTSALKDSANKMIALLNAKIERKTFETSALYAQTQKHKAAVQALLQFTKDYPDSKYKEEALYLMVKSQYEYAIGSIAKLQLERLRATNESYLTFAAAFPESKWLREAQTYYEKSSNEIENLLKPALNQQ